MLYCGMDSMVYAQNSIMARDTMIALGSTVVQAIDLDPTGIHETCFVPTTSLALDWFNELRVDSVVTSMPSIRKQRAINLYPNPTKGIATVDSEEITSIEVYDMTGALIIQRNSNKVDMTNLNSGIYFVIGFDKHNYPLYKGKIVKD